MFSSCTLFIYQVTIFCLIVTLTIGLVSADYYGAGFPVAGGPGYGPELVRYKKVPFPYRSGRNIGYGPGGYLGGGGFAGGYPLNDGYEGSSSSSSYDYHASDTYRSPGLLGIRIGGLTSWFRRPSSGKGLLERILG